MAISVSNDFDHGLHLVRFHGRLGFAEMMMLGRFYSENLFYTSVDVCQIVEADADLSGLTHEQLDQLRAYFDGLLAQAALFQRQKRSLWVCASTDAQRVVGYWLGDRRQIDHQGITVSLVKCLAQAGGLFSVDEIAALSSGAGFVELAHIEGQEAVYTPALADPPRPRVVSSASLGA